MNNYLFKITWFDSDAKKEKSNFVRSFTKEIALNRFKSSRAKYDPSSIKIVKN